MDQEPVAWRAMEQGWSVVSSDGVELGKLDQITGDIESDIFNGITVGDGGTVLTRAKYVPAEYVAHIWRGEIVLSLSAEDARGLEAYRTPVSKTLAELAPVEEEQGLAGDVSSGSWLGGGFWRVLRGGRSEV